MARDLFGDVVHPSVTVGTGRWYTVPLSVFTHVFGVAAVMVVPLLATGTLPIPRAGLVIPVVPVVPTPPELPDPTPDLVPQPVNEVTVNIDAAPLVAPERIVPEPPRRLISVIASMPTNLANSATAVALPAPPAIAPVRVGGDIKRPGKIKHVDPAYPSIAKAARVEGMVIIEATIGTDGSVRDARVIRSVRMLDQAALDAVSQWRYTPTLLNGQAVEVIMSVNVTFAIN